MQTLDHEVLQRVAEWLCEGQQPWLCTIVRTLGSSPRPIGSMLAVLDTGEQVGTVSGGCVEEALLEQLQKGTFAGSLPESIEYGVSAQENERLGLPCGGRLTLLIQRLQAADSAWVAESLKLIDRRCCVERHLDTTTGTTALEPVSLFTPLTMSDTKLSQCFGPRMRMLLVGAGQLAQNLSELALAMDYEVLVTDPRQSALDHWLGPDVELIQGMPDDVIRDRASDKHSIVITLTHDPRIDDMALMEALETEAWYVGALGSVRTTQQRLSRLRALELTDKQIAKLHAPVGLSIGSKTPLEISVAIMAQLTQLRSNAESE
ncbi:MAG: XdhC family protein [Halioglobus sp.]